MRTRSPVLKEGVASWVMTCTVPLSIRKVMRYTRSEAIELPVVPDVLAPPTAALPVLPAPVPAPPLWRGIISILVTVLLGALELADGMAPMPELDWPVLEAPVDVLPALPMASLPVEPVDPVEPLVPAVLVPPLDDVPLP